MLFGDTKDEMQEEVRNFFQHFALFGRKKSSKQSMKQKTRESFEKNCQIAQEVGKHAILLKKVAKMLPDETKDEIQEEVRKFSQFNPFQKKA